MTFYRFPHTPHLSWLGQGQPRDDKVLPPGEVREILEHDVVVEEKVDGANVGFSVNENGDLQVQNRGSFLTRERSHPQFAPLWRWLQSKQDSLAEALFPDLILFGEWCYAVHSIRYTKLPDWFLAFDVFDRCSGTFWSVPRRDELVWRLGLALVPRIGAGRFDLRGLQALLATSQLTDGPAEGLYVRRDDGGQLVARAKLVNRGFTQAIDEHWSRRSLVANLLSGQRESIGAGRP